MRKELKNGLNFEQTKKWFQVIANDLEMDTFWSFGRLVCHLSVTEEEPMWTLSVPSSQWKYRTIN